jgi:hypothetical protein
MAGFFLIDDILRRALNDPKNEVFGFEGLFMALFTPA